MLAISSTFATYDSLMGTTCFMMFTLTTSVMGSFSFGFVHEKTSSMSFCIIAAYPRAQLVPRHRHLRYAVHPDQLFLAHPLHVD